MELSATSIGRKFKIPIDRFTPQLGVLMMCISLLLFLKFIYENLWQKIIFLSPGTFLCDSYRTFIRHFERSSLSAQRKTPTTTSVMLLLLRHTTQLFHRLKHMEINHRVVTCPPPRPFLNVFFSFLFSLFAFVVGRELSCCW